MLHDWREAQKVQVQNQADRRGVVDRKLSRPLDGWIKVNVDATGTHNDRIGVGCVARNSQGHFIGARYRQVAGNWSPREAEAISLREALLWTKKLQVEFCEFETDS